MARPYARGFLRDLQVIESSWKDRGHKGFSLAREVERLCEISGKRGADISLLPHVMSEAAAARWWRARKA
ncbi:hypothetical protein EMIT0P253_150086 [Pseudomonas sp. IT-P253]